MLHIFKAKKAFKRIRKAATTTTKITIVVTGNRANTLLSKYFKYSIIKSKFKKIKQAVIQ